MVDTDKYSSPVPVIGLYIAGATLVCFILIVCDVWAGFRRKKSWLPCQLFSINAVTLQLLSIATKLPVDLTTAMPSAQDQLSKLTGTIFICMCMGFFLLSLGTNGEFESYANMGALTIFVITVVVNICMQMTTGLIFSFIVEHAIILFCMFPLLVSLWLSALSINGYKGLSVDRNKNLITTGESNMLQRLKGCYLYGYDSNPQYVLCKGPDSGLVSLICTICSVVLFEAVLRSLACKELKFSEKGSDYKWSVSLIVMTQILTIVVIALVIGRRWITFASHIEENFNFEEAETLPSTNYLQLVYSFYMGYLPNLLQLIARYVIYIPLHRIHCLIATLSFFMSIVLGSVMQTIFKRQNMEVKEWALRKGVEDMEKWVEKNQQYHPRHLVTLLSSTPPSQPSLTKELGSSAGYEMSCLSMLLLVEMTRLSIPLPLSAPLVNILGEVFDTIYFIDGKTSVGSFKNRTKLVAAKVLWAHIRYNKERTTMTWLHKHNLGEIPTPLEVRGRYRKEGRSGHEVEDTLEIMYTFLRFLPHKFIVDVVDNEAGEITKFFARRSYASIKDIYDHIEQLFVDMLHSFLVQLPKAIFNHIVESPVEEYEERVRLGLKFICQFKSLEAYVRWSFPTDGHITSLTDTPPDATHSPNSTQAQDNIHGTNATVTANAADIHVIGHGDNSL